jgi:hypothetical protein
MDGGNCSGASFCMFTMRGEIAVPVDEAVVRFGTAVLSLP